MKKNAFKKIVAVMLTLAIISPQASFADTTYTQTYKDLPPTHWAFDMIEEFTALDLIHGYPDGTFKPSEYMTTGEFVKLCASVFEEGKLLANSKEGHWAKNYYDFLLEKKVFSAEEIPLSHLNTYITRADMAYILAGMTKTTVAYRDCMNAENKIKDIEKIDEHLDEIIRMYALGVLEGYPDGTYKADSFLKRAEATVAVSRHIDADNGGYKPSNDGPGYVPPYDPRTPEEIQEEVNNLVAGGMFQIYLIANPVFEDGTSEGRVGIENKDTNTNSQIVEIYLTADDTMLYQSGEITVGSKVETITLLEDLPSGNHEAYAVFYNIDSEGQILGKTTANIIITVKN